MAEDTVPVSNTNVTPEVPSAFSLFKPSWEGVQLNIVTIILVFLVPTLVLLVLGFIISLLIPSGGRAVGLAVLFVIGALIYAGAVGPALILTQLKSGRMEKVSYDQAFECSKKFWARYIGLSIVVGLVVSVGLILLIVPGIIFIRRYFLSQFTMIDQDLSIGESMRASNELSKGRAMAVFGVIGVDILIGIPSAIPVVGSFITFILQIGYFCAPAIRYEQLKGLKPVPAPARTAS